MRKELEAFNRLLEIMDELREKCPWDKKQTIETLRTLTIEETYELADAIIKNDMQELKKELGDILLHIVFYAKIGSEKNEFTILDVINGINEKLVRRHPHVFGDVKVNNSREVEDNWEAIKMTEKDRKKAVLSGVPESLPAMVKANRIQQKVRGVGFDWEKRSQIWDKVKEELSELQHEVEVSDQEKIEAEFGDLFFSLINAARLYDVDPESALERTNKKFVKRFNFLEAQTIQKGISLRDMTLDEMNVIWEAAKEFDE